MNLKDRNCISIKDFSKEEILTVMERSFSMEKLVEEKGFSDVLNDKLIALLFFEPSTRTRLSFESAALRLGAKTVSVADARSSSGSKGETIPDAVRIVAGYSDCIVLRQPEQGLARIAADNVDVPLVNAGDGSGEHPTQALLDLYTIYRELGSLEHVTVAMVGDLKYGRTVHSLSYALAPFRPVFIYCSPEELKMPGDILTEMRASGIPYTETTSLEDAMSAQIIYMTRIQRERFPSLEKYEMLKGSYILDKKIIRKMNRDILVLHPLPRVDEIAEDVDKLPNALYFKQARNGMFVRMALLSLLLKGE